MLPQLTTNGITPGPIGIKADTRTRLSPSRSEVFHSTCSSGVAAAAQDLVVGFRAAGGDEVGSPD